MPRGSNRPKGAPALPGAGRRPKPLAARRDIRIPVDLETAALAQRLMLHFPDQPNVASLFCYALRRLAETTDD